MEGPAVALIGEDIGGYRVVERIGAGGMATVYRAELASIGAQVAIKVMADGLARDPAFAKRFVAEARFANLVRHDGLVSVLGFGVLPDGRPYQVMEYLTGESLAAVIARVGRVPLGTLCRLAAEACDALAAIHRQGLVHRDLKPANLFITGSGRVKVIDFGVAKLTAWSGLTRTGQTLGTPEYMAPEQLEDGPVDGRTDVYALGMVLYEAVTGARPFERSSLDAYERWFFPVPSVRELAPAMPAGLDAVIRKALQRDPDRRYADATAMRVALDALAAGLPADAFAPITRPPPVGPDAITAVAAADAAATDVEPATTDPADVATTREPVDRIGRYQLCGPLGHGGAGVVMVGLDPAVGRRVALKVLRDPVGAARDRLIAEARAMARVVHPNVVTLYELGDHHGRLFLAMELVEGTDLASWLADRRRPWREVIPVFVAAGHGLAAAHAAGVVHRDFKPSNVVLGADRRARVTDFGVAHDCGRAGAAGGTPAYMAPEQVDAGAAGDARTDQFAWCASLWEAIHRERAFAGDTPFAIARAARAGAIRAPADRTIPAALTAALRRGLAPTCADRFPSMDALLAAVTAATGSRARRRAGVIAVAVPAAVAVVVALGAAVIDTGPGSPVRTPTVTPAPTTLATLGAMIDPGDRLRALAHAPAAIRDGDDGRWIATEAAAAGPTRALDAGAPVVALGFSPDNRWLAIATAGAITIDAVDGSGARTVATPAAPRVVIPAADGAAVTALIADGVIDISVAGGAPIDRVRCAGATASPDLRYVACPIASGQVAIHAIADGHVAATLAGMVGFSADGGRALTQVDGALTVVDLATGGSIGELAAPAGALIAARGDIVAVVVDRRLRVMALATEWIRDIRLDFAPYRLAITPGPTPEVIATARDGASVAFSYSAGVVVGAWSGDGVVADVAIAAADPTVVIARAGGVSVRRLGANRTRTLERDAAVIAVAADGATVALATGTVATVWYEAMRAPVSHAAPVAPWSRFRAAGDGTAIAYVTDDDTVVVDDLVGDRKTTTAAGGATVLGFARDLGIVALATDDGLISTWTIGPAAPPPASIGRVPGPVEDVAVVTADRAFVQTRDQVWLVARGAEPFACGARHAVVARGGIAVLADTTGAVVCDGATAAIRPLTGGERVAGWTASIDGHRIAGALADRVVVWRSADGGEEPFPIVAGGSELDADRTGDRVAVTTVDGVAVIERGAPAAIALARSTGARIARIAPDGRQVTAMVDHRVMVWDVARPDHPHVLGEVPTAPFALGVSDAGAVTTVSSGDGAGHDADLVQPWGTVYLASAWSSRPAAAADIAGWIRRVTPR